jgi:hypothetical protein
MKGDGSEAARARASQRALWGCISRAIALKPPVRAVGRKGFRSQHVQKAPPKAECNSTQISLGPGETADCDEPAKNKRPEVEGEKSSVRVLTIVQATVAGKGVDREG